MLSEAHCICQLDVPLTKPAPIFYSGRGLCLVDRAVGQTLWRRVSFTDDHQVYPRQLLPGQSGGQWLSFGELSLAGHWWHVWAARYTSRGTRRSSLWRKCNERTVGLLTVSMHCLKSCYLHCRAQVRLVLNSIFKDFFIKFVKKQTFFTLMMSRFASCSTPSL